MRARAGAVALLAILAVVSVVVYGCGGSSSSSTGPSTTGGGGGFSGGSGAVVQGQLVRSPGTALGESRAMVVLRSALGIGLAEAAAGDPVANTTVTLSGTGGTFTTTTSDDGNFIFPDVPPGTYTLTVTGYTLDATSNGTVANPIVVGVGDTATLTGTATQTAVVLVAHVTVTDVTALLQNAAQLCHAVSIATADGKNDLQAVINDRLSGKGWGQIVHSRGVSAKVLGNNKCSEDQLENASLAAGGHGHGNGNAGNNSNAGGNGKGKGKGQS